MNIEKKEKRFLILAYFLLAISIGYMVLILFQEMNSGSRVDTNFLLKIVPPVFLAISSLLQIVSRRSRTPKL